MKRYLLDGLTFIEIAMMRPTMITSMIITKEMIKEKNRGIMKQGLDRNAGSL